MDPILFGMMIDTADDMAIDVYYVYIMYIYCIILFQ